MMPCSKGSKATLACLLAVNDSGIGVPCIRAMNSK